MPYMAVTDVPHITQRSLAATPHLHAHFPFPQRSPGPLICSCAVIEELLCRDLVERVLVRVVLLPELFDSVYRLPDHLLIRLAQRYHFLPLLERVGCFPALHIARVVDPRPLQMRLAVHTLRNSK